MGLSAFITMHGREPFHIARGFPYGRDFGWPYACGWGPYPSGPTGRNADQEGDGLTPPVTPHKSNKNMQKSNKNMQSGSPTAFLRFRTARGRCTTAFFCYPGQFSESGRSPQGSHPISRPIPGKRRKTAEIQRLSPCATTQFFVDMT